MPAPTLIGHDRIAAALWRMVEEDRLPQTLLFAGPRGVGKATLARHLAAGLNCETRPGPPCGECSTCERIFAADLSQPEYRRMIEDRRKLPAAKRNAAPLVISTYSDFLTFPPDGPMRRIGIEQARLLRSAAKLKPGEGRRRVFLLDEADRASSEAANALLKTLEEPAPELTIVLTSQNPYLLPATIRSRSVPFYFAALTGEQVEAFLGSRGDVEPDLAARIAAWSGGSPGVALSLDEEEFLRRRQAMLALVSGALSSGKFAQLSGEVETLARRPSESIDELAAVVTSLLRDLLRLHLHVDTGLVHTDITRDLRRLASRVSFDWTERALVALNELERLQNANIQKQIALEAYALSLSE